MGPKATEQIIAAFVKKIRSENKRSHTAGKRTGKASSQPNRTLSPTQQKLLQKSLASDPNQAAVDQNPDAEVFHHAPCILSLLLHQGQVQVANALLRHYASKGILLRQDNIDAAFLRLLTSVDEEKFERHRACKDIFITLLVMGANKDACDPDGYSALALCRVHGAATPKFFTDSLKKQGAMEISPPEETEEAAALKDEDTASNSSTHVSMDDPDTVIIL